MIVDKKVTSNSRLGFIGLGYLGSRIARRLAAAEFPMVVYDRDPEKTKQFAAAGAAIAPSPEKLAADADVVLSCLPSDAAVKAVYFGAGGLLESAKPGTRLSS
jgi:3-hydroxyisobutyrate dehydrogenase